MPCFPIVKVYLILQIYLFFLRRQFLKDSIELHRVTIVLAIYQIAPPFCCLSEPKIKLSLLFYSQLILIVINLISGFNKAYQARGLSLILQEFFLNKVLQLAIVLILQGAVILSYPSRVSLEFPSIGYSGALLAQGFNYLFRFSLLIYNAKVSL